MSKREITLQLREPQVGAPPQEFPLYGMDIEKHPDGGVSVTVVLVRKDGRVHIIQDVLTGKA